MPVKLNKMGRMIKDRVDALSVKEKRDRNAIYNAMGDAMEDYFAELLAQLTITVAPTPALQTTTSPTAPTGPAPQPVVLVSPPGGYFK
jgi:hypothetical protein